MSPYSVLVDSPHSMELLPDQEFAIHGNKVVSRAHCRLPPVCVISGRTHDLVEQTLKAAVVHRPKIDFAIAATGIWYAVCCVACFGQDLPAYYQVDPVVCFGTVTASAIATLFAWCWRLRTNAEIVWYANREALEAQRARWRNQICRITGRTSAVAVPLLGIFFGSIWFKGPDGVPLAGTSAILACIVGCVGLNQIPSKEPALHFVRAERGLVQFFFIGVEPDENRLTRLWIEGYSGSGSNSNIRPGDPMLL